MVTGRGRLSHGHRVLITLGLAIILAAPLTGEVQSLPPSRGLDPRAGVCHAPGGLTVVAGGGFLEALDADGAVLARTPLATPWPARVAATAEPGTGRLLIAVVQGRPGDVFDRLRFRGVWRSAPPLVGGRVTLYAYDPANGRPPAHGFAKLWDGPGPSLNPWWVGFGDFTGTGRPSLLAGVWKTAVFDPLYDRRPFVYALYQTQVPTGAEGAGPAGFLPSAQWLGSRLSNPFVDLATGDADGDGLDEIVAVTTEPDGRYAVSTYDWSGFGFVLGLRAPGFRRVAGVTVLSPGHVAVVGRGATGGDGVFIFTAAKEVGGPGLLLPLTDSAPLPTYWNRPGGADVTISGGGWTIKVSADGHASLLTAPGR
ncbi:MAG: hypothetical protein ACYC9Q_09705 [Bacillota bacterium]